MDVKKSSIGLGALTAIASSLCCITPLLALFAGTSGIASSFQWLEPLRPWLIGFTIIILGFAWYQLLKPVAKDDCDCEEEKVAFFQTKPFMGIVTIFALLMLSFPSYAHILYPKSDKTESAIFQDADVEMITLGVSGMTCTGCEGHINHALDELPGVIEAKANYKEANTTVKFDKSKSTIEDIKAAINGTGYKVRENAPEDDATK